MPSSSQLSIFPSPSKQKEPISRQPQLRDVTRNSTELRGLALHLVTAAPIAKIQQANESIQHTTHPENRTSQDSATQASGHHRFTRASSPNLRTVAETWGQHAVDVRSQHHNRPPLRSALKTPSTTSTNPSYKHSSASTGQTSVFVESPATDYTIHSSDNKYELATRASQTSESHITTSPEVRRDGAASAPPERMNRTFPPRSQSLRSGNTAVSNVVSAEDGMIFGASNRSMFPRYDSTKPLSQQQYYPPQASASTATTVIPVVQSTPKMLERKDSGLALPGTYECVPEPDYEDIHSIWRASTRLGSCGGRKVQLSFRQVPDLDNAYSIGGSHRLFTSRISRTQDKDKPVQLCIEKIDPTNNEIQPLSNIALPSSIRSQLTHATCNIPIFPHQAAVDALTAASNSPQAMAIAQFDPQANSRAAETLAKEAVSDAHQCYTSELIRTTRATDSIGTVSAKYTLQHPIASELAITVVRSVPISRIYTSQTPQVKVTIHHPSATSAAISEDSLALASVDFGRKTCIIDLPGILALEAEYMLDTAIAALLATAAMESEHAVQQVMTFAAPPTVALREPKKKRNILRKSKKEKSSSNGLWSLRKTGVREIDEPAEEMPSVAKGALAILELGINGAFWALEKGFKTLDERVAAR